MDYNPGSNRESNFKRELKFITNPITPELYDAKSCYQLIVSMTNCENRSLGIFINVNKSHS